MIRLITSSPKATWRLSAAAAPRVAPLPRSTRWTTTVVVPMSTASPKARVARARRRSMQLVADRVERAIRAVTAQPASRSTPGRGAEDLQSGRRGRGARAGAAARGLEALAGR